MNILERFKANQAAWAQIDLESAREHMEPYCPATYFIQGAITKSIKIGQSIHVKSRLKSLQIGSGEKLQLLLSIPVIGNGLDEGTVRERFKKHRLHGEWFSPAKEILDFIAEQTKALEAKGKEFHDPTGCK